MFVIRERLYAHRVFLFYTVAPMAAPVYVYSLHENEEIINESRAINKFKFHLFRVLFNSDISSQLILLSRCFPYNHRQKSVIHRIVRRIFLFPAVCVRWYQPSCHNSFLLTIFSNLWLPTFSIHCWK
jgi:hypothetical protein